MSDKRDADERLREIVALAEQIIERAKAAQAALPAIVEPPERTSE